MSQDSHHIDLGDPPTCTSSSFLNSLHIISMNIISFLIRWSSTPKPRKSLIALTLVHTHNGKKRLRDYTCRESGHHAQPKAWCHSGGSLPAGDGSHSTDQPKGTKVGHAGFSMEFSKGIPETYTSKAEHSNTQQDLSEFGYTLARN
jgi:hypothetical protein